MQTATKTHLCLETLPTKAKDGQLHTCTCGKVWAYTQDERVGNYWLPHIKPEHNKYKRQLQRTKARTAAQKVWYK